MPVKMGHLPNPKRMSQTARPLNESKTSRTTWWRKNLSRQKTNRKIKLIDNKTYHPKSHPLKSFWSQRKSCKNHQRTPEDLSKYRLSIRIRKKWCKVQIPTMKLHNLTSSKIQRRNKVSTSTLETSHNFTKAL